MIKKSFIASGRKVIVFEIENKVVRYFDEIWKDGMQILPKDPRVVLRLMSDRGQSLKVMAALIMDANKGKNLKEYHSCETDEDIAILITKECLTKGLMEVK